MQGLFNSQQTILVLGLGETGASVLRWLEHFPELTVIAADTRDHPPQLALLNNSFPRVRFFCGTDTEIACQQADVIIVSPGVPLSYTPLSVAQQRGALVLGDVEVFARVINQLSHKPIVIGITGSNGKSTVTTMVGEILKHAGYHTAVVGNIGTPVLDVMAESHSIQAYVLELSSFQLETTHNLYLDAATVLNVSEDHLDRYQDMDSYAAAKERIFRYCKQRIVNRQDTYSWAMSEPTSWSFGLDQSVNTNDWGIEHKDNEVWISHGQSTCLKLSSFPLAGLHNAANAMAALALTYAVGVNPSVAVEALMKFKGLPHRVEPVATHNQITFYDDSKGTNVGATVAALEGLPQKVVLIAGGDGKGQDFSPLSPALNTHGRALVLIGRDAPLIEQATLHCGIPIDHARDMKEAVVKAMHFAQTGDAVLLSPACASFDMFDNYLHRAQVFIQSVKDVIEERAS